MVLVLAALRGTAFGTGVIVGLAVGGSMVVCAYACRDAHRVGWKRATKTPAGAAGAKTPGVLAGRRPRFPLQGKASLVHNGLWIIVIVVMRDALGWFSEAATPPALSDRSPDHRGVPGPQS
jgi:hypothetical protein